MTSKILRADGTTYLSAIQSVVYHESVNADIDLRPGCVSSSYIEVVCYGSQSDAQAVGEALKYYQTVNGTDTLIGTFYAEPSIPTKNSYSFVAYDAVHKLDADFSAWLSANQDNFPYTVYQLVSQACTIAGVTLGTSSWEHSTMSVNAFYADGLTCRNILQYAAEIGCKFVRCNTSGEIIFDWYKGAASGETNTASGAIATFDDGADRVPLKSLTAQIDPVQSGTGDPSPDNIRAISGWTGLEGKRTGKNLIPDTQFRDSFTKWGVTFTKVSGGHYKVNGTCTNTTWINMMAGMTPDYDIPVSLPIGTYTLSCNSAKINCYIYRGENFTDYTVNADHVTSYNKPVTGIRFLIASGRVFDNEDIYFQLEQGTAVTDYEPYSGETLSVSWQSTAGTVYGGTMTVNEDGSGELVVENGFYEVTGQETENAYGSGLRIYALVGKEAVSVSSAAIPTGIITDSGLTVVSRDAIYSGATGITVAGNAIYYSTGYLTAGTQVCYKLATPLTYHFDNLEQLTTLLGTNNVWVDTGDVEVEYYPTLGRIYPSSGTDESGDRFAYKQDGLTYDNYDTSALARVAVHPVGEDDVAYYYPTNVTSGNTLNITNNALLYGASSADMLSIAQSIYTTMTAFGTYRPMSVEMFPNECPFKCGDIVPVTDAQGVSFTTAIMEKTVTDSEVTLTSTGREVYGDYALDTAKQLVQLAADIVRINKLKVGWAEIDTAVVGVLTSQGIMAEIDSANQEEQLIYKTVPSGTSSVSPTTTWITNTADQANTWTKKRPSYDASYPVLFVATQRKAVDGTITCTTPLKDNNSTTISGGQITTGTIDASTVNVTNINADNITTGALKVYDANDNIIFQADKDLKTAQIGGFVASQYLLTAPPNGSTPGMQIGSASIWLGNNPVSIISGDENGITFTLNTEPNVSDFNTKRMVLRFYAPNGTFTDYGFLTISKNNGTQWWFNGSTRVQNFSQAGANSTVTIANPSAWRTALGLDIIPFKISTTVLSGSYIRYPVGSGTDDRITANHIAIINPYYSTGFMNNYFFTGQCANGYANIYVRNSSGAQVAAGTTMNLAGIFVKT